MRTALIALALTLPLLLVGHAARASLAALAPADGQVFDLALTLQPQPAAPGSADCAAPLFRSAIEGHPFQLQFTLARAGTLQVTLAPVGLSAPAPLAVADPVPVAQQGATLSFGKATVDAPGTGGIVHLSVEDARLELASSQAGATPDRLAAHDVRLSGFIVQGDVGLHCSGLASGEGRPDTTPPDVFFGLACRGGDSLARAVACPLTADGEAGIWFSEPVLLEDAAAHLSAVDQDGAPVTLFRSTQFYQGYGLAVGGDWPLGGSVTVRLSAGMRDRAGNPAPAAEQTFDVIADPGPLDLAQNGGFESGDLSGYTVGRGRETLQITPATVSDYAAAAGFTTSAPPVSVVDGFRGVEPAEGAYLAVLGDLGHCPGGEITLTARLSVPPGATALLLDYDLVFNGLGPGARPLLAASLRSATGLTIAREDAPGQSDFVPLEGTLRHTDWRHLAITVPRDQQGGELVLTLHVRPALDAPPPALCARAAVLLDNLRFAAS